MTVAIPEIMAAEGGEAAAAGSTSTTAAAGAAPKPKPKPTGGGGQLDELIGQQPQRKSRKRPDDNERQDHEDHDADDNEDQEDEEEEEPSRSGPGNPFTFRRSAPIETASGWLLGVVLWAVAINYLRGGPQGAVSWIKAKALNKTSKGAPTLIPNVPTTPTNPTTPKGPIAT